MLDTVGRLQTELDKLPNDLRIYVSIGDDVHVVTKTDYGPDTGDVHMQTKQVRHQIFDEVFDVNHHDTRYAGGTEALYSDVMAKLHDGKDFQKEAKQFMNETIEWHKERRWSFQPHPDFEKRILEIANPDKK